MTSVSEYPAASDWVRTEGGFIDAWLVDEVDAEIVDDVVALGISCRAVPLMMTDVAATAKMAAECMQAVRA